MIPGAEEKTTPQTEFSSKKPLVNACRFSNVHIPTTKNTYNYNTIQQLHQASLDLIGAKGLECNSLASELEAYHR